MSLVFLGFAIASELAGTLSLRVASRGRPIWFIAVAVGYLTSLGLLTLALDRGLGLGVAYGIWAASGVALTAIASKVLFEEPLTSPMMGGILLIAVGVLMIELGGH
ncbi:Multidrug resistance protein, SMR family [metagenome]|uniref:Multidrug resistance protein, SMR family n=1 Tax=metagenome TaxID=256318 RepID=A0A2P2C9B0_9ZZZZ